jgi:hypothetical protein
MDARDVEGLGRDLALKERAVYHLALAGTLAVEKGNHDPVRKEEGAHLVRHPAKRPGRRSVRLAGDAHEAPAGLSERVEGRALGIRARSRSAP